ncbi:prepilin-type N-terminal cleavage/methylation domain-containing protein [Magnetospirillum fulvum]|uniref:General secretion pathway protein I n=1 Tax=Magnetospirillum fulvum TaxID=1082 RepID=A0A1H6IJT3_MAGFU|nr:prepilin-type N-terminal cleavage/methylation domain-containing protein [Magnetospirillum fulvum]SEH48166.1 general secretion pathway protein I [Magnetospirillum fulvum]
MTRPTDQGFALIEAMVAVTIIAAAAAAMVQVLADGAVRSRAIATQRTALLVAQSRLAAVGRESPVAPGFTSGTDGAFVWSVRIGPYQTGQGRSSAGDMFLVAVAVRTAGASSDAVELRSLRLAPPG